MFFELELTLCDVFPCLSPFDIRRKSAYEVFLIMRRLNESSKVKGKTQVNKIRKPAGDDWF